MARCADAPKPNKPTLSPGRELRVPSVYGIASKGGRIAKIFVVIFAIPARGVGASDPGDADPCSQSEVRGRSLDNLTHDLMTGNQTLPQWRKLAFDNVEVGPANTAGPHAQQHLSGSRFRFRYLLGTQRPICDLSRGSQHGGFQCDLLTLDDVGVVGSWVRPALALLCMRSDSSPELDDSPAIAF